MYPRVGNNYRITSIAKRNLAGSTDTRKRHYNFSMITRITKYKALLLLFIISQIFPKLATTAFAQSPQTYRFATAYELIDAVNTYRSQRGLPAYKINSILMGTAQSQADYMASIGKVTHTGPGGISFPDRLIAAGYSFVFRSENILSANPEASGWSLVTSDAWADAEHQHTLLSPDLVDIGAGVAASNGRGYYVIDTGGSGGTGSLPVSTALPGSTSPVFGITSMTPVMVTPNTPKPDGSITHLVQPGETLWSIAIAYKTTINEIKSINRLVDDNIYPGNILTIVISKPTSTPTATATVTPFPTSTSFIFWTVTSSPVPTATAERSSPAAGGTSAVIVGAIIASALVMSGAYTAFSARKKKNNQN